MMNSSICQTLGIEFPLFAFTHCRDVAAAVSRAGGMGIFGASRCSPEQLDIELRWIDAHVDGKPYGVDLLVPENLAAPDNGHLSAEQLTEMVPAAHRAFVLDLLHRNGIAMTTEDVVRRDRPTYLPETAQAVLEVAFRHPIGLVANALGIAPQSLIDQAHAHGVPVAALVGAKEHAVRQVQAGVDIIVAQGTEAGGHCGEVSTLVLVPEVIRAIRPLRDVPVLAAGGIMTGQQMAACMAMGAAGAWTGSVWLATVESEVSEIFRQKMVAATSRDTVRSKARTGKPSRQLRSAWHAAWEAPGSPPPLPMPGMPLLSHPAFEAIEKAAAGGNLRARDLVSYYVGQGVGLVDSVKSATAVVQEFKEGYADAVLALQALVKE